MSSDPAGHADDMSQQPDERETYHGYSVDDEDQPQGEGDALVDNRGLDEPLDEGYSPPEKWSAGEGFGNTPLEEAMGESLDQRVAQEVEEPDPYAEADAMSVDEIEGRDDDEIPEVGDVRAGRLVDQAEGVRDDTEKDLVAEDVGVDGAGASAEEAAVHVIREEGLPAQSSADDLGDLA